MKKLKILELTQFSAGICGVWQRVQQEAQLLSKKYDVRIFSSNATKGSKNIAKDYDKLGGMTIERFPFIKAGGESFMFWDFEQKAIEFRPDIIITHNYRHPHTTRALKIQKKLKKQGKSCRVFLVTHAPFIEDNLTRSFIGKVAVKVYDLVIGRQTINKFDKVIAITKWELPYLAELKLDKSKIEYIPNGIPDEFFESKLKQGKNIFFLGRISPVKNLKTLIKAVKQTNLKLDIVGPAERDCLRELKYLSNKQINFLSPVYNLKKKISLIDQHKFFVLPSKREAMPQALIEAMARGKIVISSRTQGGKEIIENGNNGFLFEIGDEKQLTELINKIEKMSEKEKSKIQSNAVKKAENFKWSLLIKKLENLF